MEQVAAAVSPRPIFQLPTPAILIRTLRIKNDFPCVADSRQSRGEKIKRSIHDKK